MGKWQCPCGRSVPLHVWQCFCGQQWTQLNSKPGPTHSRQPSSRPHRTASRPRRGDARRAAAAAAKDRQPGITTGQIQALIDQTPTATPQQAKEHPQYIVPPTASSQHEGYRQDARKNIHILATLVLATRAAGNDDEESLHEISVHKYGLACLEPIETRKLRNRKAQTDLSIKLDRIGDQIEELEKKRQEGEEQMEHLQEALRQLEAEEATQAAQAPAPAPTAAGSTTGAAPPSPAQASVWPPPPPPPQPGVQPQDAYLQFCYAQQRQAAQQLAQAQNQYTAWIKGAGKGSAPTSYAMPYPASPTSQLLTPVERMTMPQGGLPPQFAQQPPSAAQALVAPRQASPATKRAGGEEGAPPRKEQAQATDEEAAQLELQLQQFAVLKAQELAARQASTHTPWQGALGTQAYTPTQAVSSQEYLQYLQGQAAQAAANLAAQQASGLLGPLSVDPSQTAPTPEAIFDQQLFLAGMGVDQVDKMPIHMRRPQTLQHLQELQAYLAGLGKTPLPAAVCQELTQRLTQSPSSAAGSTAVPGSEGAPSAADLPMAGPHGDTKEEVPPVDQKLLDPTQPLLTAPEDIPGPQRSAA